jgi:Uma2 family endonuclease
MTRARREEAVAALPVDAPDELSRIEGGYHEAKASARRTLDAFFREAGRDVFVSGDVCVYYPGEPRFAPDVFVVIGARPGERARWVVSQEGHGLDVVIEVYCSGDPGRLYRQNVIRYARLRVQEYFIFDCLDATVLGYRLLPAAAGAVRAYDPIDPEGGRLTSEVLGLELSVEEGRLRFAPGGAPLPEVDELVAELRAQVAELSAQRFAEAMRAESAERHLAEAERRAEVAERQLAEAAERRLVEAQAGAERRADGERASGGEGGRSVRFEQHEGSGYPLRVVYPDGSWLAVNREHRGLFSMDSRGRLVQLLEPGAFQAASPRQLARAYKQVFGQLLSARAQAPGAEVAALLARRPRSS